MLRKFVVFMAKILLLTMFETGFQSFVLVMFYQEMNPDPDALGELVECNPCKSM